ncbi:class I SAM-dependent rRNA methyltransferase [Plasticicumulans acidivorans]|uniref:SAM-dependent methyltransferase n=1 Tax=Plasticicumulans acidivorans TaxID=886464 RepID=A0A317MVL4_9GAMM|nr:class I SAM-dependent rRNA methyltransferase [Plasticicumulans acidivorans]PWV62331.1 SAM-dependent methyltransferase [Plasticicumulans acidivorans]
MSLSSTPSFAPLRLKKNEERRLRAGHLWVYSNEVDTAVTPLAGFEPGQPVEVQAHNGKPLGTGYINPHSLICARLVSRDPAHPLSDSLLVHRLKVALGLRERLYPGPFYRLVHGEGDGLPGLIVDRFGDVVVVQITTAGMERMKDGVIAALDKVLKPVGILLRNDTASRKLEELDSYVEPIGQVPEVIELSENGVRHLAPLLGGQKTGWFYDQQDNRARMFKYVRGARVLDVFSYVGGWGIQAAMHGAESVMCIDSSAPALEHAHAAAELNGIAERFSSLEGDAFEALKALRQERERFDVIVCDPPAFVKRRKDFKEGALAYRRINELAMSLLERDGILISCSCSHHMARESLAETLLAASRHLDRSLVFLEQGRQGPDHPVPPAIPETEYLKAFFSRVLPA